MSPVATSSASARHDTPLVGVDLALGEQIRAALSTLGAGEREAIELAYFGGHTYREVAAMLGEPEGTVKSRLNRARLSLREILLRDEELFKL